MSRVAWSLSPRQAHRIDNKRNKINEDIVYANSNVFVC